MNNELLEALNLSQQLKKLLRQKKQKKLQLKSLLNKTHFLVNIFA